MCSFLGRAWGYLVFWIQLRFRIIQSKGKHMKRIIACAVALQLALTSIYALEFYPLGARGLAMGNVGVALKNQSTAHYYNPALFAVQDKFDINVRISLGGALDTSFIADVEELGSILSDMGDIDPLSISASGLKTINDVISLVNRVNGAGAKVSAQADTLLAINGFNVGQSSALMAGLTVQAPSNIGMTVAQNGEFAKLDLSNGKIVNISANEYDAITSLESLKTGVALSTYALSLSEVPVSYATKIDVGLGDLMVGATAKFIQGLYSNKTQGLASLGEDDSSPIDFSSVSPATTIGLDAGVLYSPMSDLLVGLVIKNLNSPVLNTADGASVPLDMMMRAGVSYHVLALDVAADMDLITNKTLGGKEVKELSVGASFGLSSLNVKAGLSTNLASEQSELAVSAGVSLLIFDAAIRIDNNSNYQVLAEISF